MNASSLGYGGECQHDYSRMHGGPRSPDGPLTDLWEGGITIDQPFNYEGRLIGYVIMRVQIDGISGYDEDQVALVAHSSAKFAHHVPIILGTPTMD